MLVAEERVLVAGEREIRRGHGDADVDADHAAVGEHFKLAGIVAALRKDGRAVGERVGVHDGQPLFKRLDTLDERDRPKDLALADGHIGRHMVKDRRANEEAVLIARHYDIAPVEHELRPVVDAALDPVANGLLVLGAHDRAELRLGVIGAADLHRHCLFPEQGNEFVRNAFLHHNDRQRHAAHAGAAIGGVNDRVYGALQIAVLENKRVVFRLALRLHALSVRRGNRIDVLADLGRADERDGLDARVGQQYLGFAARARDKVHNARGEAALFIEEFHDTHGGERRLRGCLEHDRVARGDRERHHPAPGARCPPRRQAAYGRWPYQIRS